MKQYWLRKSEGGPITGPLSLDEIRGLVRSQVFAPTSQVLEATGEYATELESAGDWQTFAEISAPLAPVMSAATVPATTKRDTQQHSAAFEPIYIGDLPSGNATADRYQARYASRGNFPAAADESDYLPDSDDWQNRSPLSQYWALRLLRIVFRVFGAIELGVGVLLAFVALIDRYPPPLFVMGGRVVVALMVLLSTALGALVLFGLAQAIDILLLLASKHEPSESIVASRSEIT